MIAVRNLLLVAGILGAIGVSVGALGAHGLPDMLQKQNHSAEVIEKKLNQCETAVRYQLFHALAILVIALAPASLVSKSMRLAAWLMVIGVVLFSGGIYSIVFLDKLGHWAIIPSGGVFMILGWMTVAIASVTLPSNSN